MVVCATTIHGIPGAPVSTPLPIESERTRRTELTDNDTDDVYASE